MATKPTKFAYKEPKFITCLTEESFNELQFTFDEFINVKTEINVERFSSHAAISEKTTILEAAKSMHQMKIRCSRYTFSLSANGDLNKVFQLPEAVKSIDLYSQFSPIRHATSYLRERSKLFYGFQKGYRSHPHVPYGGLSAWLLLISGELELTLYEPTEINLSKFSVWDSDEEFKPQTGTEQKHTLKPKNFIFIPAGWITIVRAKKDSFALGGEFLHYKAMDNQLECFERSVIESQGRYAVDRDREIRYVHWFTGAKLLCTKRGERGTLSTVDEKAIEILNNVFAEWKRKHDAITSEPFSIYAPPGLNIHLIRRNLTFRRSTRAWKRKKTLSLERKEASVDVAVA